MFYNASFRVSLVHSVAVDHASHSLDGEGGVAGKKSRVGQGDTGRHRERS